MAKQKENKTDKRFRLSVFRSNKFIYAQVIDDEKSHTIASSFGKKAEEVGTKIAEASLKAKAKKVSFDRRSYRYHGRVKTLADAARKGGLEF